MHSACFSRADVIQAADLSPSLLAKTPIRPLTSSAQLIEFVVIDIELLDVQFGRVSASPRVL
jgi:hypothetical protein